jgi:predicted amidophosphoribosyltransferase
MDDSRMQFLRGLNEIVFPTRCISCSSLGSALCLPCQSIWSYQPYFQRLARESGDKLLVSSSVIYSPTARRILLAAKESNIRAANKLVIQALENSLNEYILHQPHLSILGLIPIPSRPEANRLRGRDFLHVVTESLSIKHQIPVLPILGYSRRVKDQSRLNSKERWNNLVGSLVVRKDMSMQETKGLLLIDDLVTTGATLLAAEEALNQAGIRPLGAVTACVAQPLR